MLEAQQPGCGGQGAWPLERVGTCAPGSRGAKVRGSVRGWAGLQVRVVYGLLSH